jgi:hypothetical protein
MTPQMPFKAVALLPAIQRSIIAAYLWRLREKDRLGYWAGKSKQQA